MADIDKPTNETPETAPEVAEMPVVEEPSTAETGADPIAEPTEPETDKAVADITKHDGDEALKAQDEAGEDAVVMKLTRRERFKNFWRKWWANPKKRYSTIGVIVVLLGTLFGVPLTRYDILGLALKSNVTVEAVDSKTGAPVSGAVVTFGGATAKTEANGKATLHIHTGSKTLQVAKKYYTGSSKKQLVTLSASSNTFKASLVALGRQVQLKVVDKISGKPIAGVVVSAKGTTAKTDANGTATVVVPSGADTQATTLTAAGYNTAQVSIVAAGTMAKNTFSVTPAGKLYFLSNLSGKIDVVKTNLDGTDRQTVLAGTGSEEPGATSLLASRDWKYLALLSKRDGDTASVYLIDTTNGDKLTTIDQGNANFSFVGWSGDRFIYQVNRTSVSDWQPNQQALKSLDASTGQTLLLDQTQGSGTSANDYVKQYLGSPYVIGGQVVYAKNWTTSYYTPVQVAGKSAELDSINADGSSHKVVKSFTADAGTNSSGVGISTLLYTPDELYIDFGSGGKETYYDYDNGTVTADSSLTSDKLYSTPYPTFLLSPSGNSTFWSEQRDGKNTLFTGDADAKNSKQVASLSAYDTYGWYTDNYLLVSKNSSELYILSPSGGTPLKITDYYKPAINYQGYGGGYGGR